LEFFSFIFDQQEAKWKIFLPAFRLFIRWGEVYVIAGRKKSHQKVILRGDFKMRRRGDYGAECRQS